jgi:hypothetical protein
MEGLKSIQTRKELQAKNFEREAPSARAHNMQHLKQLKNTEEIVTANALNGKVMRRSLY